MQRRLRTASEIVALIVATAAPVLAQHYMVRNYSESDGIPNSYISDITQGIDGRIWILTRSGLVVYDGTTWERVDIPIDNPELARMHIDARGRPCVLAATGAFDILEHGLWIETRGSTVDDVLRSSVTRFDFGLVEDESGTHVFAASLNGGVHRLLDGAWIPTRVLDQLGAARIRALQVVGRHVLVASDVGLGTLDADSFEPSIHERLGIPHGPILGLALEPGDACVGEFDGLWIVGAKSIGVVRNDRYVEILRDWNPFDFGSESMPHFAADGRGQLFFGDAQNLWCVREDSRTMTPLGMEQGLVAQGATALFVDRERLLWVGTRNGLSKLVGRRFVNFDSRRLIAQDDIASTLELASGDILCGHNSELSILRATGIARVQLPMGGEDLNTHGRVLSMCRDDGNGAYLAGWALGLGHFDGDRTVKWYSIPGRSDEQVSGVARAPDGGVWVGGALGVDELAPDLASLVAGRSHDTSLARSLVCTPSGVVYAATLHGLSIFDGRDWRDVTNGESAALSDLFSVHVAGDGRVWIGSRGGLEFFDGDELVAPAKGDPSIKIPVYAIFEDLDHRIWIGTRDGVYVWNGATLAHYSVENGLAGRDVNRGACLVDRLGRVWIGTERGLSMYERKFDEVDRRPPTLQIVDFDLGARRFSGDQSLDLGSDEHSLIVRALAASFVDERRINYRYRMVGFDPKWIESSGSTMFSTRYTNLPPGEYRFEIQASTVEDVSGPITSSLPIVVEKPFWRRGWFLSSAALSLAALVFALNGIVSQRRYARRLAVEVRERTRELSSSREEIAREKERLAATLASIADAVIAIDEEGRVLLMNRAAERLFEIDEAHALRRPVDEIVRLARTDGLPFDTSLLREPRDNRLDSLELTIASRGADGSIVSLAVAPILSEGRTAGAVIALQDISERRRLESQLARSERLKSLGVLAGGIAHDFNNVLTAVGGQLGLLELELPGDDHVAARLRASRTALDRAGDLAQQLLTFARGGEPVRAPASIAEILRDTAQLAFSGSSVSWTADFPDDLRAVDVDKGQVNSVFENLLINARQAMPHGGRVTIGAQNVDAGRKTHPSLEAGRFVRVDIDDQGFGIAPEHLERVFDPFFTTKPGGTGLGLATAYSIVHRHGGAITVRSRVGAGTTFSVFLPIAHEAPTEAARPSDRAAKVEARVLVLDDQREVLEVLAGMLERCGCEVLAVDRDSAAVESVREARDRGFPFEVALLDLTLPGGPGGVDVARRIAAVDPNIKLVAMSGYSNDPVLAHPSRYGFHATLKKPFRLSDLTRMLESLSLSSR